MSTLTHLLQPTKDWGKTLASYILKRDIGDGKFDILDTVPDIDTAVKRIEKYVDGGKCPVVIEQVDDYVASVAVDADTVIADKTTKSVRKNKTSS